MDNIFEIVTRLAASSESTLQCLELDDLDTTYFTLEARIGVPSECISVENHLLISNKDRGGDIVQKRLDADDADSKRVPVKIYYSKFEDKNTMPEVNMIELICAPNMIIDLEAHPPILAEAEDILEMAVE